MKKENSFKKKQTNKNKDNRENEVTKQDTCEL